MTHTFMTSDVFYTWLSKLETAASGVIDANALPAARRKAERDLAQLTTPMNCLQLANYIRENYPSEKFPGKGV